MSARLLLLALGPTLLTACPGRATHITDATRGFIKQRESERHGQFKGDEPVDINALATVVITAVGAKQAASRSYPTPGCDVTSGRALCVRTSRGGATQQDPGLDDYASTQDDQSQPWWTAKAKNSNQRRFMFTPNRDKAARGLGSEVLSGGGWILLAALPAIFMGGAKPNVGEREGSRPMKTVSSSNGSSSKPSMVVKKRSAMSRAGQGGDTATLLRALVPENPYARAIGVVAIAVLGSCGLYLLKTRELLLTAWPITVVESWQVLTVIAWAINMRATSIEGRLDGSSQANPSEARRQQPGFFTPASWAFTIWAPIILGEMLFVLYQLLPLPAIRGSWWLYDVCPWFCGAMLFQSLWCASFRPWARDIGLLWLPALLLGGTATALGRAHRVLRIAWFAGDINFPQYIIAHLPLSLHFGWISCASLVNLNGYFASVTSLSNRAKLALSLTTVVAAVILGVYITLLTEDPVFSGVVAWALWAVGSEGGWRNLKGRVDPGAIRTQELVAKAGSIVALAVASAPVVVHLMDIIAGGGETN